MDIADPEVVQKNNATDATQETPQLGSDRYRVLSTLGAGGMGVVYLAEDLKLHRKVAVKKLRDDIASQNARERIQQEARLLAQLNHPNIVALHDVLEDTAGNDTSVALVMEYIEGTTLRAWMRERGPSLQQKLSLLMQICLGLQQAHDLGIIHRDLKADNILIAENAKGEPVAKITDFGIAKSQQLDEKTLTAENQLAGTITAMSPEQILGKTLTARSDLFSLGAIAYELLCGSRPFEKHEAGALAMANRITNEPHIPPQQAWPNIPEPLAVLLDKLLAKEPAQRPENAQIVYQGFALLHKQGMEAEAEDFTATLTDLFTQQKVKSRRRWQRVVAGVAATLILGAGSYWGWKEFTRLEPQYIAVMPVEIHGEIRGEENAKALTKTMVRQALMNSVSQLKASALVSFEPTEGQTFEENLQALRDKGATDALLARLECTLARCNIELQRITPQKEQILQQISFPFLTENSQEAAYRITNTIPQLFPTKYTNILLNHRTLDTNDYEKYLEITARVDQKNVNQDDLKWLEKLIGTHPENINLYRTYVSVATTLYVKTDKKEFLQAGTSIIDRGKIKNINGLFLLEMDLWLNSYNSDPENFEKLIKDSYKFDFPSAEIQRNYSRFLYLQGKYEEGVEFANNAAKLNPSTQNYYLIALNEWGAGKYDNAEQELARNIAKHPRHWPSYGLLGAIKIEKGEYLKGEETITKIPSKLRNWRVLSNLAGAYFLQRKYYKALETANLVLQKIPDDIPTVGLIAESYIMLGRTPEAESEYGKILELTQNEESLEARMYKALAHANLEDATKAIALVHELLQEAPNDTYVKYTASQVYSLAREFRSADLYIKQLIGQGMDADWFALPAFQSLCTQPIVSQEVKVTICT
ncbi:serine/threonine-protein kinase [Microbulbifer agarilyticus]|uniref:serine/threonine-protein kinase n=1 Tax=Microbulbifer agarilyticus TaxID=260552 RepID=UPI001CD772FF|nr:serine/threonine-protein kinase [Microbulbifer agarilyticus]MCA0899481.1 protein kinase [Microbulbifer agarilyticus]